MSKMISEKSHVEGVFEVYLIYGKTHWKGVHLFTSMFYWNVDSLQIFTKPVWTRELPVMASFTKEIILYKT